MENDVTHGQQGQPKPTVKKGAKFGKTVLYIIRFFLYILAIINTIWLENDPSAALIYFVIGSLWVTSLVCTLIIRTSEFWERVISFLEILVVLVVLWGAPLLNLDRMSMLMVVVAYNVAFLIIKLHPKKLAKTT